MCGFHLLAIFTVVLGTRVCNYLFKILLFSSSVYIPTSGMARADDNSILNILRNHHTVLHNGCAILPSHHFCHRGCSVFTALPTLVTVAILVGVRWPFPEALICMSLRRREWLGASSHVSWFNLLRFFFTLFHCIWRSGSGEMFPLSSLARTAPALQTTAQVWKDSNTSGMERLTFFFFF